MKRRDDRGAAVRHERQRDAGDRHDAHRHADVLEHLDREHREHADGEQRPEEIGRQQRDPPEPPREQSVEQQQRRAADEAEILADHGEDEVGVLLGYEASSSSASPGTARRPSGRPKRSRSSTALRLYCVGSAAATAGLPAVDWSVKPVSRSIWYACTLPVTTAAPTSVAPSSNSTTMCTGLRPATTSTAAAHTMITSIVPRSCCAYTIAITTPASTIATASRHASRSPRC